MLIIISQSHETIRRNVSSTSKPDVDSLYLQQHLQLELLGLRRDPGHCGSPWPHGTRSIYDSNLVHGIACQVWPQKA